MVFHVCVLLECCWRIMCWNWWFWFVCCAAKFCFAAATEPPVAKWYSLPIYVLPSKILFRSRNWTCCSEVIFTADLCVAQPNSVSLPQLNLLQRSDIRCRWCGAQRNYVSLPQMNLQNMTQILPFTYQDWNPDQTISKWPQIKYLVFQYHDNKEYKFIGRSLMSRYLIST